MTTILDEVNFVVSRRRFLKASVVLGGVVASTQLLGKETLLKAISPEEAKQLQQQAGQTKTVFEILGQCGGLTSGSPVCADVQNGRIIRIRPIHYDWLYPPESFGQWSITAGGKTFRPPLKTLPAYYALAYKERVYSPARVAYPMLRADFDYTKAPADRLQANRGVTGYVRISWDEAYKIVTSELTRLKATYGPASLLAQGDYHGESGKTIHARPGTPWTFLQRYYGGCTTSARNPDSWEGMYWGAKHVWGMDGNQGEAAPSQNSLYDFMVNGTLALFWGCDPETIPNGHCPAGTSSLGCYWLKQAGKRVIYICPDLNFGAAVHADKWIPLQHGTDSALYLALAYVWITEGTYDTNFIATHTIGFDESSLAPGQPPGSSFKSYVLGITDGVPKTPKWAEGICAVPSRTIKALARVWANNVTSMMHCNGGPGLRGSYCSEPARLEVYDLLMQGIGKPGSQEIKWHEWMQPDLPWAKSSVTPSTAAGSRGITTGTTQTPFCSKVLIPFAIIDPTVVQNFWGSGVAFEPVQDQFIEYTYPVTGYSPIRAIWSETPCRATCMSGNIVVQSYRSPNVEFFFVQHFTLETDALFADLVLPVTTCFENDIDITAEAGTGQWVMMLFRDNAIPPIGESKSDAVIVEEIAAAMGYDFLEGKTHTEWAQLAFASCGTPSSFTWDDFVKNGYYVFPVADNWESLPAGLTPWYQATGAAAATLNTKSGLAEFWSQWLNQYFPNDTDRPPMAHYIADGATHKESLFSPRTKLYPLMCESNHPRWREHQNMDDNAWLREIWSHKMKGPDGYMYQPMWIHPTTAAKYGIMTGDIVRIYNERGGLLAITVVTERLIPGAIYIDHGARLDPLALNPNSTTILPEMSGLNGIILDRGGEINLICPSANTSPNCGNSMDVSVYLVQIEKVDLAALAAQYPAAWAHYQDPNVGSTNQTWSSDPTAVVTNQGE